MRPEDRAVVRLRPKADARAIRHGYPWVWDSEMVTDRPHAIFGRRNDC